MEGGSNTPAPHRLGAPSLGANLLNGWLKTREDVRRRLNRDLAFGIALLGGALIALPAGIWSFLAERSHQAELENAYASAKKSLTAAQREMEKGQPGVERALKFERLAERTNTFLNNELQLIAASPERVVLNTIAASAIQGKITLRVSADASDKEQKRAYEARASAGPGVLASFVTNVTLDRPVFPGGLKFDYVKIVEVGR